MSARTGTIPPLPPRWKRPLAERLDARRDARELRNWQRTGMDGPPPSGYKRRVLREWGQRCALRVLVETGTFLGDTVQAMRGHFARIISIELSEELHERASRRFAGAANVELIQGDSGIVLETLVPTLEERALFWLDGHYSAGFTALGADETPVFAELDSIFRSPVEGHVVLIDDARLFTGDNGWPTVEELRAVVHRNAPGYGFQLEHDIIEIFPLAT